MKARQRKGHAKRPPTAQHGRRDVYPAKPSPIEAVMDNAPRRDSLIFAVDVWKPDGLAPETLWPAAGHAQAL
jgi:hypothetical protein